MTNLAQVQTFLEVARSSSFAKAARGLSLPRSTVTARVQALEERLGVRLLHRTTRNVSLTEEGQRYYSSCEKSLGVLMEAENDLISAGEPAGTIRISVPIDFPKSSLAGILGDFTQRYPAIGFVVDVSDDAVDLVANNFDLALRGRKPGSPGLVTRKLGGGQMVFVAMPKSGRSAIRRNGLGNQTILDPARMLSAQTRKAAVVTPVQTTNFELAKAIAIGSDAIAILPRSVCAPDISAGRLVELNCDIDLPEMPLHLVMPSRSYVPKRVRAFVDFLTSQPKDRLF